MKYSFPYCEGTFDYLWKNPKLCRYVNDIYFSDNKIFHSARNSPLTKDHWDELYDISEKLNIPLNYIMNPSVYDPSIYFGEQKEHLASKIKLLKTVDVTIITFNNTMLMNDHLIKKALEPYEVKNSVNNMVINLEQVKELVEVVGLKSIFLGRDINRNMSEIKRIHSYTKDKGIKLHLLCNENCYPSCVYKVFCDDLICTASQKGDRTFNELNEYRSTVACDQSKFSLYQKLANNIIYPSQVKHYEDYIDVIKISGRLNPIDHISQVFEAYVNEDNTYLVDQMYNGLIIPQGYYDYTLNCKNKCASCSVCDKIAEEYEDEKNLV